MSLLLASQKKQRTFSIFIYFVFKPYPQFSSFAGLLDFSLSLSLSLSLEMTPVFLNPPPSSPFSDTVLEQKEEQQLKLAINSQYSEPSSSLSSPITFFNSTQDQRAGSDVIIGSQQSDQKAVNIDQDFTSSQSLPTCEIRDQDNITTEEDQYNMISSDKSMNNNGNNNGSAVKYWMSSKMRLMQKMSNPAATTDLHHHHYKREKPAHKVRDSPPQQDKAAEPMFSFSQSHSSTSGTVIRVCSDCNTTTTPLWRSGPRGPKSLCNACGIRQRKARRAMAEAAAAANGLVVGADSATTASANHTPIKTASYYKTQYHINKEKKSRANHSIGHYKNNKLKLVHTTTSTCPKSERNNNNYDYDDDNINNNKLCLRKLSFGLNDNYCSAFSGVFPKDVAEAAVLLMELSCGFVHS